MIRVMIVEDEPPIAKSIKHLVEDYDNENVRVAHIAINGVRALEYLEKEPVDIIFSDIKMPIMDGLTLAKHVQEKYPGIIMVIISGFQEFEFARSAMRSGVSNYLLKPVSKSAMNEVLDVICKKVQLQKEISIKELLDKAIHNEPTESSSNELLCGGLLLICVGPLQLTPDEIFPSGKKVWRNVDFDRCWEGILNSDESCIWVKGRRVSEKVVLVNASCRQRIIEASKGLYQYLLDVCPADVTMIVYNEPVSVGNIGEVFKGLHKKLYHEIRLFKSQFILSNQTESLDGMKQSKLIKEVVFALKTGDQNCIREAIYNLTDVFVQKECRQAELTVHLEKLLLNYFEGTLSIQQIGEIKSEIHSVLSTSLSKEELMDELTQVLYLWAGPQHWPDKKEFQDLCEKVAAYIRLNYRLNITNTMLAKEFSSSPALLAKKFKEYFGFTISEYINNYRIELAQAIIRNDKKMMIKEIAWEVGYNDPYYFSKIFKKITGCWPSEYLRDHNAVED